MIPFLRLLETSRDRGVIIPFLRHFETSIGEEGCLILFLRLLEASRDVAVFDSISETF